MLIDGNLYYKQYDAKGEGWEWDAIEEVLYLDHYKGSKIECIGDLRIIVKSNSTITHNPEDINDFALQAENLFIESDNKDAMLLINSKYAIKSSENITINNLNLYFTSEDLQYGLYNELLSSGVYLNNVLIKTCDKAKGILIYSHNVYLDTIELESFYGSNIITTYYNDIGHTEIINSNIKAETSSFCISNQDVNITCSYFNVHSKYNWLENGSLIRSDLEDYYSSPDGYNYRPYDSGTHNYYYISFVPKDAAVVPFYKALSFSPETGDNLIMTLVMLFTSILTIVSVTFYLFKKNHGQN